MTTFLAKPAVKIVITDSGLGGLSICAELSNNLARRRDFAAADIIWRAASTAYIPVISSRP